MSYPTSKPGQPLSPREWQVLRLSATGLTVGGIACVLGCSTGTIRYHRLSIYLKLSASTLVEALAAVGWLTIPEGPGRG